MQTGCWGAFVALVSELGNRAVKGRTVVFLSSLVFGLLFTVWERGIELGHVLRYLALAAVSFFIAQWLPLLLINTILGVTWVLLVKTGARRWPMFRRWIVVLNRQLGHVEAMFAWVVLVLVAVDPLWLRLPLAVAMALWGGKVIDTLARALMASRGGSGDVTDFHLTRRPFYYVLTTLGLIVLVLLSPTQWRVFVGPAVAVAVGIALRMVATQHTRRAYNEDPESKRARGLLRGQGTYSLTLDRVVLAMTILLVAGWTLFVEGKSSGTGRRERLGRLATVTDCQVPALAAAPDVSLFLVSDNQFHELRGERTGIHLDLVDRVVPVAVRPVELDLLSGATVRRFANLYGALRAERARQGGGDLLWAHLGDIGDVACASELDRFGEYMKAFGPGTLAGIAPGNHDSTFFGNFVWHPDWPRVCWPSQPLTKRRANDQLATHARDTKALAAAAIPATPPLDHTVSNLVLADKSAWPTVTVLGAAGDGRKVVGVFLDSADYTGFNLGIAGVQGAVSLRQKLWLQGQLAPHADNAYLILFSHHPFDELSSLSRSRVDDLVQPFGDRLLALVSAHTHMAARRKQRVAGRPIVELIVGSVLDAPQEAALLEVYTGATPVVRLRTIPSVSHVRRTCGFPREIKAETCADRLHALMEGPACRDLFQPPDLDVVTLHASRPAEVRDAQLARARHLRACVCRDGACAGLDGHRDPFDARFFDELAAKKPERREELVCLSWAGSVLQSFKHQGWPFARALAHGFDGAATLAPLIMSTEARAR